MKKPNLSSKQKKYCRERVAGKSQVQAYYDAGYSKGNGHESAQVAACRLEKDERIKAELARLTALAESGAVLDRKQRIAMLSEMAMDTGRKDDARQRALDMLNRMHGDYTDRQITEVNASLDLSYEEKRQAVLDALRAE